MRQFCNNQRTQTPQYIKSSVSSGRTQPGNDAGLFHISCACTGTQNQQLYNLTGQFIDKPIAVSAASQAADQSTQRHKFLQTTDLLHYVYTLNLTLTPSNI